MYIVYRVNADELTPNFLDALKTLFKHKTIEITYLLSNPANRARLLEAIDNVANKRNLVTVAELPT